MPESLRIEATNIPGWDISFFARMWLK